MEEFFPHPSATIKSMKKFSAAVLTVATIVGAGLAFRHFVNPYETIDKIADGDTFILEANHQAVRLFGLDAPEMDNCYGPKSFSRLSELLKQKKEFLIRMRCIKKNDCSFKTRHPQRKPSGKY